MCLTAKKTVLLALEGKIPYAVLPKLLPEADEYSLLLSDMQVLVLKGQEISSEAIYLLRKAPKALTQYMELSDVIDFDSIIKNINKRLDQEPKAQILPFAPQSQIQS